MPLTLKVVSTKKLIFEGEVDSCELPAKSGIEEVLPKHFNYIAFIKEGVLRYKVGDTINEINVKEGFSEVSNDSINVLIK
jgi:F0F1-type ATP synthase epsilon subunit